ncbi:transmembrane protein, putative [Bodo saltans]|uniref:Transmembrane protein, putative n=1 Tax=Bodo saltans TaxID=75058 RepID=A0A0S4JMW1_BODSA|nr:transmembrane protein, putative [Bodo saltans]|eukprot:CUG91585.1 transmembrane protein, putative [Bodo saltans]
MNPHNGQQGRQRQQSIAGISHPASSSSLTALEEAVPSLELLEDSMKKNTLMSLHPSIRAARGGVSPEATIIAPTASDTVDETLKRRSDTFYQLRAAQGKRKTAAKNVMGSGDNVVFSTFLAGSGDAHESDMPPQELETAREAASEVMGSGDNVVFSTFLAGSGDAHESDMPPQELETAREAASEFDKMQMSNILGREAPHATGNKGSSSSQYATPQPTLKHPNCVPPSQYVKTQLDALRFSMERGYQYHTHFDDHVSHAFEARRVAQSRQPSRTECGVDFVNENIAQLHDLGSPQRLLQVATRERELKAQRATASKEAIKEWFTVQIERKRDMAQAAAQRRAERRAQQQHHHRVMSNHRVDVDDDESSLQQSTVLSASTAAANVPDNIPGPLAALSGSGLTTEREILGAVQSFWLIIVAAANRTCGFTAAAEDMARQRREATEAGIRRRRLDTEHMDSLLALDTMKRKYDRCRSILKVFVQNRVRAKHSGAVDLIVRLLRHRHRIKRTIYQVHWFRHSVIICQRQVRVFLQSLASRKMLLHLQWIRKECALLQVPNGALACIHQQWSEQRRVVETTQRIFATQAALSSLQQPPALDSTVSTMAGGKEVRHHKSGGKGGVGATRTVSMRLASHHHPANDDGFPIRRPGAGQHFVIWSTRVSWVPPGGVPLEVPQSASSHGVPIFTAHVCFVAAICGCKSKVCIHQQWSEQRRVVETTQRIFATQAALSSLQQPPALDSTVSTMAGGKEVRHHKSGGKGGLGATRTVSMRVASHHHPANDDGFPIRRPGAGQYFVFWSTRVSWVPPGGVPLEYRNLQVHMACQSSLRTFVSSLLSADASRKFFVKQKARYETDGLEALGLPKPKLPTPPIFQLFMPSMALRLKVSLAVKEKGNTNELRSRASGPPPKHATSKSSALATTTADDAPSTPPSSELSIPRPPPLVRPKEVAPTDVKEKTETLMSKLRRKAPQSPQKLLPVTSTPTTQSNGSLLSPSRLKQPNAPPSHSGIVARKPSTVTLLSPVTPMQKSSDSCASSPRRSVFEHFESREDLLPSTVRSDEEYAQLLGKPTVAAMRHFLDTKNTLHLRPTTVDEKSVASMPRSQRVPASGPQLSMHLNSIHLHYEGEVTRKFEEQYHSTVAPEESIQRRREMDAAPAETTNKFHQLPSPRRSPRGREPPPAATNGPLLGDGGLIAHRPPAMGVITRRQHEERLRHSGPDDAVPQLALHRPQPPMGFDAPRDVPKLLAFCGSSDAQRRLMATGGSRFSSNSTFPSPGGASTARRPVEGAVSTPTLSVALLQDVIDSKAQSTARARSKLFM